MSAGPNMLAMRARELAIARHGADGLRHRQLVAPARAGASRVFRCKTCGVFVEVTDLEIEARQTG